MRESSLARMGIAVVCLSAVLAAAGCSKQPEDPVLASVGSEEITQADFLGSYAAVDPGVRSDVSTVEARKAFLEDLVNRELMEAESRRMFPEPLDFQKERLESFKKSQLTTLLMDRLVRAQSVASAADKDLLYATMQKDLFLEGLLVPTEDMAQAMVKRLTEGADLHDLAAEYSILEYPGEPGVIGWVSANTYLWVMEKDLWSVPPGKVVGPYPNRFAEGFWVVRYTDSRTIPAGDTRENLEGKLTNDLTEQLYMSRQKAVQDSIQEAAGTSYPEAGAALMMFKYYWEPPDELRDDPMAYLSDPRVSPTYTAEEETVTVVGFTKYPSWTAVDFTNQLSQYPSGLWPRGHDRNQLQEVYTMVVREYLHVLAAKDLGLDKDPDLLAKLELRERRMRVNYLYHNVLTANVKPTEEEVKAWFEENRERYKAPPAMKIAYFGSANGEVMESLRADWMGGMSFNQVREKYEGVISDLEGVGESPFIPEGTDPALDDHILNVKTGDVAPIFQRSDKSYAFKVIERRGSRLVSFDEAKDNDFLAEARKKHGVTFHDEAIAAMVVPDSVLVP